MLFFNIKNKIVATLANNREFMDKLNVYIFK